MLSRRDVLKLLTATAATLQLPAAEPGRPLFFTNSEFALLDALTEMIIPADDHSPGAHAAEVAVFLDRQIAQAILPEDRNSWRKGLASIDQLSVSTSGTPFLQSSAAQQMALMTKIAAAEAKPQTEAEKFFTQLKQTTAFAYYTSSIGIHKETRYKGNVILQQFVGYDAT